MLRHELNHSIEADCLQFFFCFELVIFITQNTECGSSRFYSTCKQPCVSYMRAIMSTNIAFKWLVCVCVFASVFYALEVNMWLVQLFIQYTDKTYEVLIIKFSLDQCVICVCSFFSVAQRCLVSISFAVFFLSQKNTKRKVMQNAHVFALLMTMFLIRVFPFDLNIDKRLGSYLSFNWTVKSVGKTRMKTKKQRKTISNYWKWMMM